MLELNVCFDWVKVALYQDPKQACLAVVKEAQRLWLKYETRTDDITIIVVHVDGLKDVRSTFLVALIELLGGVNSLVIGLVFSAAPKLTSC